MKAKLTLAALLLAGAASTAHAKNPQAASAPPVLPPGAASVLDALPAADRSPGLADFLAAAQQAAGGAAFFEDDGDWSPAGSGRHDFPPNGLAFGDSPPGGAGAPPFKPEWAAVIDYPPGLGHAHAPPIPEPETYALLLAGLGVLAVANRWRKNP